jgi:hypothetical protein
LDPIPAVERQVAGDLARRALIVTPLVLGAAALWRGGDGAAGAAISLALVACNFYAGALSLGWAARRSPAVLASVALGGFLVRMGFVLAVVLLAKPHVDSATLGLTLVLSHIGLLFWETRSLSLSLAAPALRPSRPAP